MNRSNLTYYPITPNATLSSTLVGITFTGKEKDEESGYGYFGARYMNHELMTMWLSVDPMADKYPRLSPYAYCAWNPIRLIDEDGKEPIGAQVKIAKINNNSAKKHIRCMSHKLKL